MRATAQYDIGLAAGWPLLFIRGCMVCGTFKLRVRKCWIRGRSACKVEKWVRGPSALRSYVEGLVVVGLHSVVLCTISAF